MRALVVILAVGLTAAFLVTPASAQEARPADSFQAAPVLVRAGDANAGEGRLYPSPVMHDINGDGYADLLLGDLMGIITVAPRLPTDGPPRFGPEERLKAADGEDLKFHNW